MKSLKINFDKMAAKYPRLSTYACFVFAVKGQKFGKKTLQKWFNRLVDKEDYSPEDKKVILSFLYNLSDGTSKVAEDGLK